MTEVATQTGSASSNGAPGDGGASLTARAHDTGFYEPYVALARSLRVWFIAYGIGGPVLFLSNETAWKSLIKAGQARAVALLFLAGVATQVITVLIHKAAMWPISTWKSWDLGLPRLRRTRKRMPRQMKLFEKPDPADCVQVDVKFVKIAGRWAFQYTALDDCTRFRILRLCRRLHQTSSLAFVGELCRAFPFRVRKLQCDNGQEFPFAFVLAVQALGIRHRYIKPRRPQQNGKVERSHRIDQEEFWGRQRFADFDAAAVGLRAWETRYNHKRFSLAL
jgi:hypothetical protein